jgi:ribosome-binding factor A
MAELASKQVELEGDCHDCQIYKEAFCAQVVESEQQKNDALVALKEVSEKSDGFKRDCEGT